MFSCIHHDVTHPHDDKHRGVGPKLKHFITDWMNAPWWQLANLSWSLTTQNTSDDINQKIVATAQRKRMAATTRRPTPDRRGANPVGATTRPWPYTSNDQSLDHRLLDLPSSNFQPNPQCALLEMRSPVDLPCFNFVKVQQVINWNRFLVPFSPMLLNVPTEYELCWDPGSKVNNHGVYQVH